MRLLVERPINSFMLCRRVSGVLDVLLKYACGALDAAPRLKVISGPLVASFILAACAAKTPAQRKHIPLDLATWHNNQGVQYLGAEEYAKAEVEFKTAVELDPKYPEAQSNLGLLFKYRGDLKEAARRFKIAIELDPKWAIPYNHLGTVYLAQSRFTKAIDWFGRAAALDKKYADAHYNIGVTHLERARRSKRKKGHWQQAQEAFQKATQIDPRLYNAHMELANTYHYLGETEKAILRYRLAIETNPRDARPWELLADLYDSKGDAERAQECRLQASLLQTGGELTADHLLNLGDAHRLKGEYPQALRAFQAATEKQADFWQGHFGIGLTLEAMGDIRAREAYRAVLQIHPNHPESLYRLGLLERRVGDPEEGQRFLCRFLAVAEQGEESPEALAEAREVTDGAGGCP